LAGWTFIVPFLTVHGVFLRFLDMGARRFRIASAVSRMATTFENRNPALSGSLLPFFWNERRHERA